MNRLRSATVGRDAHNNENSSIVNELLTYVFDAYTNHPADCIKQNVLNFYSDAAIHDAKLALGNAYETYLPKSTERRGANQSTRELADILRSVDGIDRLLFNTDSSLTYWLLEKMVLLMLRVSVQETLAHAKKRLQVAHVFISRQGLRPIRTGPDSAMHIKP